MFSLDTLPGTGAKRIYSLKTALDSENYSKIKIPKDSVEHKVAVDKKIWPSEEIVWINRPIKKAGRKSQQHIFRGTNTEGQVKREYRHLKTPLEVIDHLFDPEILETILGTDEGCILSEFSKV